MWVRFSKSGERDEVKLLSSEEVQMSVYVGRDGLKFLWIRIRYERSPDEDLPPFMNLGEGSKQRRREGVLFRDCFRFEGHVLC